MPSLRSELLPTMGRFTVEHIEPTDSISAIEYHENRILTLEKFYQDGYSTLTDHMYHTILKNNMNAYLNCKPLEKSYFDSYYVSTKVEEQNDQITKLIADHKARLAVWKSMIGTCGSNTKPSITIENHIKYNELLNERNIFEKTLNDNQLQRGAVQDEKVDHTKIKIGDSKVLTLSFESEPEPESISEAITYHKDRIEVLTEQKKNIYAKNLFALYKYEALTDNDIDEDDDNSFTIYFCKWYTDDKTSERPDVSMDVLISEHTERITYLENISSQIHSDNYDDMSIAFIPKYLEKIEVERLRDLEHAKMMEEISQMTIAQEAEQKAEADKLALEAEKIALAEKERAIAEQIELEIQKKAQAENDKIIREEKRRKALKTLKKKCVIKELHDDVPVLTGVQTDVLVETRTLKPNNLLNYNIKYVIHNEPSDLQKAVLYHYERIDVLEAMNVDAQLSTIANFNREKIDDHINSSQNNSQCFELIIPVYCTSHTNIEDDSEIIDDLVDIHLGRISTLNRIAGLDKPFVPIQEVSQVDETIEQFNKQSKQPISKEELFERFKSYMAQQDIPHSPQSSTSDDEWTCITTSK